MKTDKWSFDPTLQFYFSSCWEDYQKILVIPFLVHWRVRVGKDTDFDFAIIGV